MVSTCSKCSFPASTSSILHNAVYGMQKLERFLWVSELPPNWAKELFSFLPTFQFPWFLTMFPCSDLFENWFEYFWNQYLVICFLVFGISDFLEEFHRFLFQNTWKNHPTFQFPRFLRIFPFSDLFENWYAYSSNQYLDTLFLFFRIF